MERTLEMGSLRVRRGVVPGEAPPGKKPLTVVLLHGFGAPGDDLVGLAEAMSAPAGTTFLFPEAPHDLAEYMPFALAGDARAWWLVDVGRYERAIRNGTLAELRRDVPEGLDEARTALGATLDAVLREDPGGRVVLGGFSQGSMLAIDTALRTSVPLVGLVVLSGTIIAEDVWRSRLASRTGLPVFQSHGKTDPILPYSIAEDLRAALADAGLPTTYRSFGGGHGIPPETMRDLGRWLAEL